MKTIKHMSGNTVTIKPKKRGGVTVLKVKSELLEQDPRYDEPIDVFGETQKKQITDLFRMFDDVFKTKI